MSEEILPYIERKPLLYRQYRDEISLDCDLLLWEPTSFYGRGIAVATGGPFSHISVALHVENRLLQAGYEEHRGGVMTFLSSEVRRHPDTISVFRVRGLTRKLPYVRQRLIDNLRGDYQWRGITTLLLQHCLGLRWLARSRWFRDRFREASTHPLGGHCAQHVKKCFGQAGIHFTKKEDSETSPNDIAMSAPTEYLGTLTWDA